MQSLTINVRVNPEDKKGFENFCNSVGMNVSTAINMFIKAVLKEQRLPFEISTVSNDKEIYEKLKEAELEMNKTTRRYSKEEVMRSMKDAIK